MKNQILISTAFFGPLVYEDLYEVVKGFSPNLKRGLFDSYMKGLLKDFSILELLPKETPAKEKTYILGPAAVVEDNQKVQDYLGELPREKGDTTGVDWEKLSQRMSQELKDSIESIKENALGLYKTPKKIELDYFEISIKYHQLISFFEKYQNVEVLLDLEEPLSSCRQMLDNLEF